MTEDSSPDTDSPPAKKRPPFRLIAVAVFVVLAIILAVQNTEAVETKLLFATVVMPRAVLLAVTFLLGIIVGLLVAFVRKRKD